MKSLQHLFAGLVRIQLDIIANCISRENAVHTPRRDQVLLNDGIEESVAFTEDLARLCAMLCVFENPGINSFQPPGVEERAPVNELAQRRQWKVVKRAHTGE